MSTREDYPAGVPCWVDTSQPDPVDAARFYSGLFGWQAEDAMPPDAGTHYYMARIGGRDVAAISSQPPGAPPQAMWNTYIRVESADDAAARVREAGGRVLSEPFDVFDAGRMGVFADPEGAVFCVWQPGSHRGSAAVNEHGAVNFNNLHTDDVEAARAFYGAVFGWTTIDAGSPMWALPGYGDHLEELNPGLRAGMKQMGAPEGFENVVATILPREGGPARWSVTFAVDDVDAIAARARELGGSVLAEPQNAPWVRFALLAERQSRWRAASQPDRQPALAQLGDGDSARSDVLRAGWSIGLKRPRRDPPQGANVEHPGHGRDQRSPGGPVARGARARDHLGDPRHGAVEDFVRRGVRVEIRVAVHVIRRDVQQLVRRRAGRGARRRPVS